MDDRLGSSSADPELSEEGNVMRIILRGIRSVVALTMLLATTTPVLAADRAFDSVGDRRS
jgi:hypothetical protein